MAELTIRIGAEQVEAVRASVHARARRDHRRDRCGGRERGGGVRASLVELRDAEEALAQLAAAGAGPVALTAHPELLSDVLHGALADATERFERACAADWRGRGGRARAGRGAPARARALHPVRGLAQGRGR